jgi:PKD repeat protein
MQIVSVFLKVACLLNLPLLLSGTEIFAKTITVDQDGGTGVYTTFKSACQTSVASAGDTILVTGDDIDYYTDTLNNTHQTNIYIIGKSQNPDSFPVLIMTWDSWWVNNAGKIFFKNIRFHDCKTIPLGKISGKYLIAENCIFQLSNQNTFTIDNGLEDSMLVLNNCLFYKLSAQIFPYINTSGRPNGPYGIVNNCTFYRDGKISGHDNLQSLPADTVGKKFVLITNSIFYKPDQFGASSNITKYYTNCLVPTSQTSSNWGSGCVLADEPLFVDTAYQYAGNGFKPRSNSPAINKGGNNATSKDMGGRNRFHPDIGAWEYLAAPQNITLSSTSIAENQPANSTIGTITILDSNDLGHHTLVLGGTDSAAFNISGMQLRSNQIFNYESKSSYAITLKAIDSGSLSYTKSFTIAITNVNDPPKALLLTKTTFPENISVGTVVCTLKTTDDDLGAHTYSKVTGGADNASFTITDSLLKIAVVPNFEVKKSYIINLKTSDGTAEFQRLCTLYVSNVNEPHTDITLSSSGILEDKPIGTLIGRFTIVDIDVPATPASFSLISGTGSTDNGSFIVQGDSLLSAAIFDYEVKPNLSIRVRSTDINSNTFDKQFTISVGALPKITTEPANKTVGVNKNTSFSVTATGPGTLGYQWFRSGISGEQGTSAQLILANVPQALDKSAFYCIVSNSFGSDTSSLCTLTVIPMPLITSQPQDTHAIETQTVSFTVGVTGLNLHYRWVVNGTDTLSSTTNTVSITNISPADSGDSIWCLVSNDAGVVKSATARIHVFKLPTITAQPINQTVTEGDSAHFSITATGAPPLTYKWYRNGVVYGTQTANLNLPPVSMADSNSRFFCIVSNTIGSDTSDMAVLTVGRTKPVIIIQPRTITLSEIDTGFMFIQARGTPPLTYAWYKKGLIAPIGTSDTIRFINPSRTLDSGSQYYCVVSNSQGSTASDTAKLLVGKIKPHIQIQPPETLTIFAGNKIIVPIAAFGSKPLTFTWKKMEDTTFSYSNDSLIIDTAVLSNSGHYFCIVKNDSGQVISDTMMLIVTNPPAVPVIIKQPVSLVIAIGDSAIFTIEATANPSPQYQWYRNGAPVSNATSKTLVLKNVTDSLSHIFCTVYNSLDTVVSDTVKLKVILIPTARFSATPLTGPESTLVTFTNQTTGPAKSYLWFFGDGKTSTEQNPTHLYTKAGLYSVTLKAIGTDSTLVDTIKKSDMISIYTQSGNPVTISAQYLTGRNIVVTYSHLNEVDTSTPEPYADSMGLWIASGQIPSTTSPVFLVYHKPIFASPTGVYKDTFTLPTQDTLFGLLTGIYYNDKQIRSYESINGTFVLLKDTITPPNPLTAQVIYLGGDSTRFTFYHINELDTTTCDSVFLTYSPDSLLQSGTNVLKYPLSVFTAQYSTGLYSTNIKNPLFATENGKFYFVLSIRGKNGKIKTSQISSFYTAGSNDKNPIILQANPLSPSSVQLYWNKFIDPTVTEIRIFFTPNEIPINMVYPSFMMDTIKPRLNDTILTVSPLNSNTTYYFGAQVRKKNIDNTFFWSPITMQSRVKVTTPPPSTLDSIRNSITILDATFTNTAQIDINWCIIDSSLDIHNLDVGVTYSNEQFPVLPHDPQIISVTDNCALTTLRMRQPVLFETSYYIALWLRTKNGPWAEPTENSRKLVKTPKFTRQTIVLFEEGVDTFKINNNSILFWKEKTRNYTNLYTDTVRAFNPSSEFPGMVLAGQGIEFIRHLSPIPFYIGLRYACPSPYTDKDVRLYRYVNGSLMLVHKYEVDALNKIISFNIDDLTNPIIPLIDTLPPVVTMLSDTVKAWEANTPYVDSVNISDNIINPRIYHFYCEGDTITEEPRSETVANLGNSNNIGLKIPASVITTTAGVRANITVDDGRNAFSINTSRKVYRTQSDEGVAQPLKWKPLSVTADLVDNAPKQLFPYFLKSTDSATYNMYRMLLFRWYGTNLNKTTPENKWVQYADSNVSYFKFNPGVVIWLKTKEQHAYHFGAGTTLSLKDTFQMTIPSKEWADIGLPFKFSTSIDRQIIPISPGADSLLFYEWLMGPDSAYTATLMYAKSLPTSKTIMTKNGSFTIYNTSSSPVTIRIPPIPAQFAQTQTVQKVKTKTDWWVRLKTTLQNNTAIPDVYCGYASNIAQPCELPSPPAFGSAKVKLYNRENNNTCGHYLESTPGNGIAREVKFENSSDTPVTFVYTTEKLGNFPDDFSTSLYNPTTSEWLNNGTVTVGANSGEFRWFVTGTDDFKITFNNKAAAFKYKLFPVYPNPVRSFATIRYSIPLSATDKLDFTIYDALGRTIWKKQITEHLIAGDHKLIWRGTNLANQKVTSGMYIVVLSVIDQKNAVKYRFDSRLTFFQ